MLSGFEKPVWGLVAALSFGFMFQTQLVAALWFVTVILVFALGHCCARKAAIRQARDWCNKHGLTNLYHKPAGGFISWGWTLWTYCEVLRCEFSDSNGATHQAFIDVHAPAFGFFVNSRVVRNVQGEEFKF